MDIAIRRLTAIDAIQAARVHRAAFDDRLPWLRGLHTPQEDIDFYRGTVFSSCKVWGGFAGDDLVGFVAFRDGWIDQFYVMPAQQGRGLGALLLARAKAGQHRLRLWTFQRNALARHFYERHGFAEIECTDGSRNEENEPDALYEWSDVEDAAP